MTTQTNTATPNPVFPSVQPEVGTLFIQTPGIEQVRNYYLVQKLLEQRVRSIMTEIPFENTSLVLVRQYLSPPPNFTKPEQVQNFYEMEAHELYSNFAAYEQSPSFQESLHLLVPYKGKPFSVSSITTVGLQMIIDLSGG